MSDFERKLAALTPAAVDRDAVLFAAGRASATSPRLWQRACGLLVVAQVVTLGVMLGERRELPPPEPPRSIPTTPALPQPSPPDPSSYLVLLRTWDQSPAVLTATTIPDAPPLTAGSRSLPATQEPGA